MKNPKNHSGKRIHTGVKLLFPLLTVLCLAGFIVSLIFPNEVLDTYHMNMSEEEGDVSVLLPLSYDQPIVYEIDTAGRKMQGIQLGISKRGSGQTGQKLCYNVSVGGRVVSENVYSIEEGDTLQYVYLPFSHPELCSGRLSVSLQLDSDTDRLDEDAVAALEANHREVKGTATVLPEGFKIALAEEGAGSGAVYRQVNRIEKEKSPSLKGSHIYSHNTYPFLYDFRILTFVFLAVSMTLPFADRERRTA